jgi:hypothetical protein
VGGHDLPVVEPDESHVFGDTAPEVPHPLGYTPGDLVVQGILRIEDLGQEAADLVLMPRPARGNSPAF